MKKMIKSIVFSIFIICLNINYVTAESLPGMGPFIGSNGIKQPQNSNWCVRACVDVALNYLKVLKDDGIITAEGAIVPEVIREAQTRRIPLNITMPFNNIVDTIAQFSHNNAQITCTRKVIVPNIFTTQQAYDEIYNALSAAQLQQAGQPIPEGYRPGIAILHFEEIRTSNTNNVHHHACVTCGINGTAIEVHDPMPGRGVFNVSRNAFRYVVRFVPRCLSEYYLIQW